MLKQKVESCQDDWDQLLTKKNLLKAWRNQVMENVCSRRNPYDPKCCAECFYHGRC